MKTFREFLSESQSDSVFLTSVIQNLGNDTDSLVAIGVFSSESTAKTKAQRYIKSNLSEEEKSYDIKVGRIFTRLEPDQDRTFVRDQFVTIVAYQEKGSAILRGIKIFPDSMDAKTFYDSLEKENRIAFKVKYDDEMRDVGIATVKKF